ncbi:ferritin heavy chain [Linepithema humile]|uniref:ferritin heavy chain n=1 Tax=Linepithema humile TaxID=83485 RepID=UPI00062368B7|nr:PREDICTED: ferritin subunit [Linepithema humile]
MKSLCVFLVALVCVGGILASDKSSCLLKTPNVIWESDWNKMHKECVDKLKNQVQMEINAALVYFAMGAHFARDVVDRPGFSKFFFESASEEREHAMKIIDYLLMRGPLVTKNENTNDENKIYFDMAELLSSNFYANEISELQEINKEIDKDALDGSKALKYALDLEVKVTKSIKDIIQVCEDPEGRSELTSKQDSKHAKQDPKQDPKHPKQIKQDIKQENINDYHLVDHLITEFLDEQYKGQRDLIGKLAILSKMSSSHGKLAEFLFDKKLLNGEI